VTFGEIPWEALKDGGFAILTAFGVWAIFTARMIPRWMYNEVKEERDRWRQAAEEAIKQNGQLLESSKTTDAAFKALAKVAGEEIR